MNEKEKNEALKKAASLLNTSPESLPEVIEKMQKEIKEIEEKIKDLS
jgi:predicted  nucleic acid-binding Zn-ribbon protein